MSDSYLNSAVVILACQRPSPKSINDRPKRSMIGRRVETTEDLARQLQKCTGSCFHPSSTQSSAAQSSLLSSLGAELGEKGRVTRSMIGHAFTINFCPLLELFRAR